MNVRRGFLLSLIALLLLVSFELIRPFLQYVMLALLLAFVLYPLQRRLESRMGQGIAASVLIVGAVIALIIPFVVIGATIAGDAMRLAQQLQSGGGGFGLSQVESMIQQYTGQQVDIASRLSSYAESFAQTLASSAPGVFETVTHLLVGLGLMVFLVFFLLKDGEKLYAWIRTVTPLPETVQNDLYSSLEDITWAVLLGHVLVAIVQGGIAGLGLIVTGIPNAVFWTFLMIVLSLLPVIGSFLIWGPAAIYLVASGQTVAGVALFVWGAIVVGATDDFLRPVVVDRYAELNPSIIIVGVIGGVYLIGFMGLFIGPVIVGALKVVLEIFDEYYAEL